MKSRVDLHRCEITFEVGEYVFLKLQPYCKKLVAFQKFFEIVTKVFRAI
jgi:hypothetical protein